MALMNDLQNLVAASPAVIYTTKATDDFACTLVSENLLSRWAMRRRKCAILLEKRKRTEEQSEARREKTADEVRAALLNEGIARQCPIGMRSG
jgi:hypothetical protein